MPTRQIQITTCDLCKATEEQELLPKAPASDWMRLTLTDATDKRRKLDVAICPTCTQIVQIAIYQKPDSGPDRPQCDATHKSGNGKACCCLRLGHKGPHRESGPNWTDDAAQEPAPAAVSGDAGKPARKSPNTAPEPPPGPDPKNLNPQPGTEIAAGGVAT
jgi:hypothetical protein